MKNPIKSAVRPRKSPGQGLVEFALALPILLLLIFGIIEFARIFAAWLISISDFGFLCCSSERLPGFLAVSRG